MDLKEGIGGRGLYLSGLGYGVIMSSCEHGNEHSCCVKCE
jgi:hypothetical protein